MSPTYNYECLECGYEFEKFQKMSDEPVKTCPKCKGKVQKLISSGAGIIFKGSGFYTTDYKKKSKPEKKEDAPKSACENCPHKNEHKK